MVSLWVVNASPIILLSKAGLIDVLQHLGAPVVIPEAAAQEIQRRGASDPSVLALVQAAWLATVDPGAIPAAVSAFSLGGGESASGVSTPHPPKAGAAWPVEVCRQGRKQRLADIA